VELVELAALDVLPGSLRLTVTAELAELAELVDLTLA
jgi:hypothetical protein